MHPAVVKYALNCSQILDLTNNRQLGGCATHCPGNSFATSLDVSTWPVMAEQIRGKKDALQSGGVPCQQNMTRPPLPHNVCSLFRPNPSEMLLRTKHLFKSNSSMCYVFSGVARLVGLVPDSWN